MMGADHAIVRPRRASVSRPEEYRALWLAVLLALTALGLGGCASQKWATLRGVPKNPLAEQFDLKPDGPLKPSQRTLQLLRFYGLERAVEGDPNELLEKLQSLNQREPSHEKLYALAELSYQAARRVEHSHRKEALDLYGASVLHAYQYLFDARFQNQWNPYDPHFRGACDLYNGALEAGLRLICANGDFKPGQMKTIETASGSWDIEVKVRGGRWKNEDFDHFKFVSDYKMQGLRNHYRSYGLGVPLIAVRRSGYEGEPDEAKYYPSELSFPVTALLRPENGLNWNHRTGDAHFRAVLEIYDPLTIANIVVNDQRVPLESDLSTPLAYFLSKPELEQLALVGATVGLLQPQKLLEQLRPGREDSVMGLYMMQPYEPDKIPVLFVHGLWSSPVTWIQMFNDLRNSPEIRRHYQFWFYLYPTGEPFWFSATRLRHDLAEARAVLDRNHEHPALDQMVLVGHSMGGLLAQLQTLDSGDDFWRTVSDRSFAELKAEPETRKRLQDVLFFQPNPSVQRVITIGTPHRGSQYSNDATQWLIGQLTKLPDKFVGSQQRLLRENRKLFRDTRLFEISTSIESLSPSSPMFPAMIAGRRAPWVRYHNIIGLVPKQGIFGRIAAGTDGVVSRESAHMDDVASELTVEADHSMVHAHPLTVLEVRRILLDHIAALRELPGHAASVQQATRPNAQPLDFR
ncbi:MAG: alpha/beta fold hydrolase [Pirellulales bacterium]|nr:alpha/beta fold hydrolase [Pirellulales bacterium]